MHKPPSPPNWKHLLTHSLLQKCFSSPELQKLIKHADIEYVHWDKFRHYSAPEGISIAEAWAYLKFSRSSRREQSPVMAQNNEFFNYTFTKGMFQKLSYIDSNSSGLLTSTQELSTETQRNQLILSGLSEEAIASSQIEGANTSRKVAKEMLLTSRKPRTRDEQMIINNYLVMQQLQNWKELNLSKSMLIDIQKLITQDTLDNSEDSGRFRSDKDNIIVGNKMTGEIVYTPPQEQFVARTLSELVSYANSSEEVEDFTHPIIKASILHFWLAYLHPFVDGNGRTARAIFYWYLLKHNYWLFQYLSVSRVIKLSRAQYDEAYLKTETDELDLTYFLSYKLKIIEQAIIDFQTHYQKKLAEDKKLTTLSSKLKEFNNRQLGLLMFLKDHADSTIDINIHKAKYQTAYQTARTDLFELEKMGLLSRIRDRKKYLFMPNTSAINKIFSK